MRQKLKYRKLRKVKLHNDFPSGGIVHTVQSGGLISKACSTKELDKNGLSNLNEISNVTVEYLAVLFKSCFEFMPGNRLPQFSCHYRKVHGL
jgi:hypothetical protein